MEYRVGRVLRMFVIASAVLVVVTGATGAAAQDASPVASPSAQPPTTVAPGTESMGASYGEWAARWWEWALSFPAPVNPAADPTGIGCGFGQQGPVFFLTTSSFATAGLTRTCTIPEGVGVLMPVIGADCSTVEAAPSNRTDEASLSACAKAATDKISGATLTIDGTQVADLASYRVQTPVVNVVLPPGNLLGVGGGPASLIGDGNFVLIEPLSVGTHTITSAGLYSNGNSLAVTYDLTVAAAAVPSS
jgi:hypothetical protein